MLNRNKGVGVG